MIYTVDRFEEKYAILEAETGENIHVLRNLLPVETQEGSVLRYENGIYIIDFEYTKKRKSTVSEKFKRLKEKS